MFRFSDNTQPTVIVDHFAISQRLRRIHFAKAAYRFMLGCLSGYSTIVAFLFFMETGRLLIFAWLILQALLTLFLLYPLFAHHEVSTTERKTNECLTNLQSR
jgi:hypothetical protein